MQQKIIVTGGAGFIGSFLVESLVGMGHDVTVFDNFSTGHLENLSGVKDRIKIVRGDIREKEEIEKAFAGAKTVFHMAALSYAEESIQKPFEYNSVNVNGTLNVLEASKNMSVQRVVFPSTCLVYGNSKPGKLSEDLPLNVANPYGVTKAAGESYCRSFNEVYGLETICFRIFNAYGPRMKNRVISKFAKLMLEKKPPVINGTGKQKRDFIFVSDIVRGLLCGLDAKKSQCGKSYNIGTGKGLDLKEVLSLMNMNLGEKIAPVFNEMIKGETDIIIADTSLARKELGFLAKVEFEKGIKETMEWLKKQHERKKA